MVSITKELAACSIYGFEITTENKEKAMSLLQNAGLVPVALANGDPEFPVAIGINKIKTEPWKYHQFHPEKNIENKENESDQDEKSEDSSGPYEIKVPQSRRAVMELMYLITSPTPIASITYEGFLTERDVYELIKPYFDESNFTSNQLNDWLGKEGLWGASKRKFIDGERIRGRTMNIVKKDLRDFSWNDISNIKELRKLVRESSHRTVTIGYVRKSRTAEKKEAVERSLNLQVTKMKTKFLCKYVFASCNTNADDKIEDRDASTSNKYNILHVRGDCQEDFMDFITMSNKEVRLVIIDYAGLSTNPDDVKEFVRKHKQLKEIVIDIGHKVTVFSRFELLHEKKTLQKFNCRIGNVKRSL